jgi:hypothetical protein
LPTFIEIEGPSEKAVWQVTEKLGLNKEEAMFGAVDKVYHRYYGVDTDIVDFETPIINFEIEPPEWAKKRLC